MVRLGVFCGPSLKRNLRTSRSRGLELHFLSGDPKEAGDAGLKGLDGVLVESSPRNVAGLLKTLRKKLPKGSCGALCLRPTGKALSELQDKGFDFVLSSWGPGDPSGEEILAHFDASIRGTHSRRRRDYALE